MFDIFFSGVLDWCAALTPHQNHAIKRKKSQKETQPRHEERMKTGETEREGERERRTRRKQKINYSLHVIQFSACSSSHNQMYSWISCCGIKLFSTNRQRENLWWLISDDFVQWPFYGQSEKLCTILASHSLLPNCKWY